MTGSLTSDFVLFEVSWTPLTSVQGKRSLPSSPFSLSLLHLIVKDNSIDFGGENSILRDNVLNYSSPDPGKGPSVAISRSASLQSTLCCVRHLFPRQNLSSKCKRKRWESGWENASPAPIRSLSLLLGGGRPSLRHLVRYRKAQNRDDEEVDFSRRAPGGARLGHGGRSRPSSRRRA